MDSKKFEKYLNYVENNNIRQPIYKIVILDKYNDEPISEIKGYTQNNSGSLTISNNEGLRRSVSLTLKNYKNEFTAYFEALSLGQRFKLWLGYEIEGEDYLFSQGVFIYSDPSLISMLSDKTVSVSVSDKFSLLDGTNGGILDATYQINKGSSIGELIRNTLTLNVVKDYVMPDIDINIYNQVTTYDIIHETGSTVADILLEVAFSLSCYIYYNQDGVFTMKPFEYDIELPSLYNFVYNDMNYFGATKMYDIKNLYNAVLVVGDNMQNNNEPIRSYLENNDPSDSNSVVNGTVVKIFNATEYTDGIDTQQKADERCRYELKKVCAVQSKISLSSSAFYHLYENTIVSVTDPYLASDQERFLIIGITFPIGSNGGMTIELVKARKYQ